MDTVVTVQRTKRALGAVAMSGVLLGLAGAVSSGAAATAAPKGQSSGTASEPTGTASGTQPSLKPAKKYVNCVNDGGYVERGSNQVIPHLDVETQNDNIVVGPIIAWNTAANAFGSRAVTSMFITVNNFATDPLSWKVSWYCTSDKSKAWLVFGTARIDVLRGGQQVIGSGRRPN
jgi:hypothetical protein